jgi:hypothetical protein
MDNPYWKKSGLCCRKTTPPPVARLNDTKPAPFDCMAGDTHCRGIGGVRKIGVACRARPFPQ